MADGNTVSRLSRKTSYSTSFQPATLFSIKTWPIILALMPLAADSLKIFGVIGNPAAVPPKVKAGRTITG
jgi:hypothetical protein